MDFKTTIFISLLAVFVTCAGVCVYAFARAYRNQAIAECQANQNSIVAQDAQQKQEIITTIRRLPVPERRRILEQWIIE